MYYGTHYASPLGDIMIACDEENLIGLWIDQQKYISKTMPDGIVPEDQNLLLMKAKDWLDDYFAGKKPDPHRLPLAPIGGAFKQAIWKLLLEIPYGELTTYGAIAQEAAKRLGKETMSAQAVGGAVGHNPLSIIIPCHRVVGATGSLTGYAGGIDKKVWLLTHEGVDMAKLYLPR
ncbi:MAG: methylated-DNA--[protein]-cysteine S-methyltransferase [Lachnospiraceae bacterium]|nr:methylated-DNA--[protein]-cysteine S-methyltransferase [Lachnospiraceae bacterium]